MPEPIRLIDLGEIPAPRTQSVYHAVAEEMGEDSPDTIIFCRPATPYLCVGYHQQVDAVLDRSECERLGLPILRRRVGGGTTLLDAHQFFYQCIFHRRSMPSWFGAVFQILLSAPMQALRTLGLNASLDEVNEIRVDGTRIAGTGGGMIGEACVVVGNVLFDFDFANMARVWRVPSEGCRELAYDALCESLTTLNRLDKNITTEELGQAMASAYAAVLARPLVAGDLTPGEAARARRLDAELQSGDFVGIRDAGPDRQWGPLKIAAGVFIHSENVECSGQMVHGCFEVCHGVIRRAILCPGSWERFVPDLIGVPFTDWKSRFEGFRSNERA